MSWQYLGMALVAVDWRGLNVPAARHWYAAPLQFAGALIIPVLAWSSQLPSPLAASMAYTENTYPLLSIFQQHFQDGERLFNDPQIGSWLIALGSVSELKAQGHDACLEDIFLKLTQED